MKQTKRILSLLLSLCLVLGLIPGTAFAASNNPPFTDVNTTDWFYDAVQFAYDKGMMSGTSATTFSPNGTTTRGMIVTVLHRMEGTPEATGMSFADVPAGQWYSNAVAWASANGVVSGYGNGKFGPGDAITREQMATILYRYSQSKDYGTTKSSDISTFSDAAQVSSYATEAMKWAVGSGLISGVGNNTLAPKGNATRAQVATILMRFCKNIADKDNSTPETPVGKTYTVTFDLNYGSDTRYDVKTVKEGETVGKPSNPSRSGYSFSGWYAEKSGGRQFDFKKGITSDMTLYAHWSSNSSSGGGGGSYVPPSTTYYTVTFNLNYNGAGVYQTQQVTDGGTVSAPADLDRPGYTFTGWYTDPGAKLPFDFTTPVTSNITLYAGWNQNIDNLEDDEIDRGDIEDMITSGDIDVIFDEYGNIRTIDGLFTDKKVSSKQDAAEVLNSAASLFSGDWYFEATADRVTSQSAGDGTLEESFYRYSPTVNGIPVLGSQIILSTKDNGEVTGLFSSYNNAINQVDLSPDLDAKEAANAAVEQLMDNYFSGRALTYDAEVGAAGEYTDAVKESIAADSTLVVYAVDDTPILVYSVHIDNSEYFISQGSGKTKDDDDMTPVDPPMEGDDIGNNVSRAADDDDMSLGDSLMEGDDIGNDATPVTDDEDMTPGNSSMEGDDIGNDVAPATDDEDMTPKNPSMEGDDIGNDVAPTTDDDEEAEDLPEQSGTRIPYIDITYYIYANGAHAGEVYKQIENIEGTRVTFSAKDMKNQPRIFNADRDSNGRNWLRDTVRNLETYKTTFGGFLWTQPQLPGELVSFTNSISKTAVSAHANMAAVYDYYKNNLNRNSFDGNGAKIIVSYDYDDLNLVFSGNYRNAFWSSSLQQMVFGDEGNYAAALDVAGHEFTHAVINYVVGDGSATHSLTYYGESGALNEAYADILGNLIEGKTGDNSGRWLLGEDSDRAIRSMASPSSYSQPEHYNNRYTGTGDNGGVHTNSGIFNFAAYKMMIDRRTIGITQETWAKVFYRSLYRLTENATFLEARGAIIATAKTLGFTAEQQQAIKDAFDAVGITEPDSIRIVLTWGATPSDLDSHLVGPGTNGGERFHIAFYQRTYYADGTYYSDFSKYVADLDYDDTTSYGPEVTTIHILRPGEYYFFVHDYSNGSSATSTEMARSGAKVKVYKGSSGTPINTFNVDPSSSGTYWNVFKLTIGRSGTIGDITIAPINTYSAVETLS